MPVDRLESVSERWPGHTLLAVALGTAVIVRLLARLPLHMGDHWAGRCLRATRTTLEIATSISKLRRTRVHARPGEGKPGNSGRSVLSSHPSALAWSTQYLPPHFALVL